MRSKIKIATIIGTRPDVIKMAPVIKALKKSSSFKPIVITTSQHRQMLDQMLRAFSISTDFDLNIMKKNQSLLDITTVVTKKLFNVFRRLRPDMVLVQGDTTTAFVSTLVAFYHRIKVGHVEAGLRTYDKYNPYPEEINRKLISSLADLHFAPTKGAKNNLIRENIAKKNIYITGNTAIDALMMAAAKNRKNKAGRSHIISGFDTKRKRVILVTAHRRESWGRPIRQICYALKTIARRFPEVVIVYPVHLNPNVKKPVYKILGNVSRIILVPPLSYERFIEYMSKCFLVLTDSGGLQEEAPSFDKPVLVMRKVTERPEVVRVGAAKVIGVGQSRIVSEVARLLKSSRSYKKMAQAPNPFGDGKAAERITKILLHYFDLTKRLPSEFKVGGG